MQKTPLWKEYSLDVQKQLGGVRYCTTCTLSLDGSSSGFASVFLQGNEPFTAEIVKEQMETLGYQTLSVHPFQARSMCWLVHITNTGLLGSPFPGTVRYFNWIYSSQEFDRVGNVVVVCHVSGTEGQFWTVFVYFDHRNKRWAEHPDFSRVFYDDESDEKLFHITREQAEKLARTLGTELPGEAELLSIGKESALPRIERDNKERHDREQRARNLEGKRQALEQRAQEWDASLPYENPDLVERLQLGQSFPLVKWKQGRFSNFIYTKQVTLLSEVIPQINLTLKIRLTRRNHQYFVVTPFCPEEGYQIDHDDFDSESRAKKLERIGYTREVKLASQPWFPVSSRRLWIEASYPYDCKSAEREFAQTLGLSLTFPNGDCYLALPTRFDDTGGGKEFEYRYDQFVLSEAGPFAQLACLPNWVSVNVPPHVSLLKAVQVQFLLVPDYHFKDERMGFCEE